MLHPLSPRFTSEEDDHFQLLVICSLIGSLKPCVSIDSTGKHAVGLRMLKFFPVVTS